MNLSPARLDTAYHPDFGQPVSYAFESMPEDPNAQVRMTVERVIRHILADCLNPDVQGQARQALELGSGDPIAGVWRAVKPYIRFRQDFDIAQDLGTADPRKASVVETLIPPAVQAVLIKLRGHGVEDCDGFTMYAGCLLVALGIPVTMCTVSAERARPREFSHVYLVAYPNGQRVAMDVSHGPYPGWECPNTGRKREWIIGAETVRPSVAVPLLIAAAAGGLLLWRRAA